MGVRPGGRQRPGAALVRLLLRDRAMSTLRRAQTAVLPPAAHHSSESEDRGSAATTGAESIFAEVLADVLRVDRVSVDSHFFDELGADSLVMAHFCARVRQR